MNARILYIITLWIAFAISMHWGSEVIAQTDLKFRHITIENGLSQNSVLAIAQDKDGFIWLGTQNGLNRYDGFRVKTYYKNSPKGNLSHNYILSIYKDYKQQLWIGTANGLNLYNPLKETFTQYLPDTRQSGVNANVITSIKADRASNILWIGTKNGLFRFFPGKGKFQKIILLDPTLNNFKKLIINDIYIDRKEKIWVATSAGVYVLSVNATNQIKIDHILDQLHPQAVDTFCTSISEDSNGNFWLGTMNDGLFRLNENAQITQTDYPTDRHIRKLRLDSKGRLLMATQKGLFVMDLPAQTIQKFNHSVRDQQSLGKNSSYSIFEDRAGSIWVGSYFGGVNIATDGYVPFYSWPGKNTYPGIADPVLSGIAKDKDGMLWIGTEGNGLIHFNPANQGYQVYTSGPSQTTLSTDLLKTLFLDKNDFLWIGTHGGGINVLDTKGKTFRHFNIFRNPQQEKNADIYCFEEMLDGKLLSGGNYGLQIVPKKDGMLNTAAAIKLLPHSTRTILKCNNGFFVGTSNGLFYLTKDQKIQQLAKDIDINCLLTDNASTLWMGTQNGLYIWDNNKLTLFQDKLLYINILSLNKDHNNNIWVSTENGLFMITHEDHTVHHYVVSDDLVSNQFNYNSTACDNEGRLFFGGNDGLTYFNPEEIYINKNPGNIVFTDVHILDSSINTVGQGQSHTIPVNAQDQITLDYQQASFTINFALLNYIKSDKNHYQYQLEGYDPDWRYSNTPTATYINLAPGTYKLHIKGFNNDNIGSREKTLSITLLPPFWRTWWAYFIYTVIFLSLVFSTIRYFFLKILYRKEEILNKRKLDFFTNISHEIRTHLTLIIAPLSNLPRKKEILPETRQALTRIESNAASLLSLVNELMDFRKIENGNLHLHITPNPLYDFIRQIYHSYIPIAELHHIDLKCEIPDGTSPVLYFDRIQMEKVFFNLLSNAFKFTEDSGKISILIQQKNKGYTISIADNGKGIDSAYKDKIFENFYQINDDTGQNTGYGIGLALSKKIVELHKGTLYLSDTPEKPFITQFSVFLKTGTVHFHNDSNASLQGDQEPGTITRTIILNKEQAAETTSQSDTREKRTILIIEDNLRIQQLLTDILSPNYHILTADNAETGIILSKKDMPDLIISDVMMPGMGGFQFCATVKQDIATSHIPVILLTARNTVTDQITGLENGADCYLTKPFNSQVLLLHIRNLLKRQTDMQQKVAEKYVRQQEPEIKPPKEENNVLEQSGLRKKDQEFLSNIKAFVEENMEQTELGVQMLAKECNMSAPVLYKKMQALTGYSIHEFIKTQRLQKACMLLREGQYNITEITYLVGYTDRKYFSKEFKKFFGRNPSEFFKKTIER